MSTRRRWAAAIDYGIEWLKWPIAVVALCALPLLAWGVLRLIGHVLMQPLGAVPLALGTIGFLFVWKRWLNRSGVGRWLIAFEHELTHAIFAWCTGHRILAIKASADKGGDVHFVGRGNWLITLAPYFFPTSALLLLVLAYIMPIPILPWPGFFLGIALGFHIVSTYRETHRDAGDLKQVGSKFCWMFLPTANLLFIGLILAWAHGGTTDVKVWFRQVREPITLLVNYFSPPVSLAEESGQETE